MATEPSEPRWGLGDAAAGFAVALVLSTFMATLWLSAQDPRPEDLSIGGQALSQLGLWAGLVGAALYATKYKGSGSLAEDFGLRFRPVDLLLGVAGAAVGQVVIVQGLDALLGPLLDNPEVSGPVEDLLEKASGAGTVLLFLCVAVGAPLVEELFFRGLLLRSLMRRTSPAWAIVTSGVLFGIAHPQPLPANAQVLIMVSLAVLGMLFAWLVVRFGRLGPAIVAHSLFNAATLIWLLAA